MRLGEGVSWPELATPRGIGMLWWAGCLLWARKFRDSTTAGIRGLKGKAVEQMLRDKRSLLNFAVLIVVAAATAVFLLQKANEAIEEINHLSISPVYLGKEMN